jgi:hypothetical protein
MLREVPAFIDRSQHGDGPQLMSQLFAGYLKAKGWIIDAGYEDDISWAEGLEFIKPDAEYVVREAAWVILNSGFRFQVVQRVWPRVTAAFRFWDIEQIDESCVIEALGVLKNVGKMNAIWDIAKLVREEGVDDILRDAADPPKLRRLPWIGKITCWHLAKVLGVDVIKPDVHLTRAAKAAGFETALGLCENIRELSGDRLTVIDSVLWRYGEQRETQSWPTWEQLWCMGQT